MGWRSQRVPANRRRASAPLLPVIPRFAQSADGRTSKNLPGKYKGRALRATGRLPPSTESEPARDALATQRESRTGRGREGLCRYPGGE
jgi:hypothetical protein